VKRKAVEVQLLIYVWHVTSHNNKDLGFRVVTATYMYTHRPHTYVVCISPEPGWGHGRLESGTTPGHWAAPDRYCAHYCTPVSAQPIWRIPNWSWQEL